MIYATAGYAGAGIEFHTIKARISYVEFHTIKAREECGAAIIRRNGCDE